MMGLIELSKKEKTGFAIFCIIFALLLIVFPCKFLLFDQSFYHSQFDKTGVYAELGKEKVDSTLEQIFSFMKDEQEIIEGFGEDEISHMKDVRNLVNNLNVLFYVLLILFVLFLIIFIFYFKQKKNEKKTKYKCLFSSFTYSGLICIIIITTIGTFAVVDFNLTFTLFHKMFFPMGNYTFDPSVSLLKQMFPNEFFYNCIVRCAFTSLIASAILIILGFVYNKWSIFVRNGRDH
jgi:integral membrane protein (TIGR01906 family)